MFVWTLIHALVSWDGRRDAALVPTGRGRHDRHRGGRPLSGQPAGVSRALARLEKEVGSPLLLRRGRMLRPTHAGSEFKRHIDAALHDVDDGLAAVDELIDPETGSVSIAFQLSLGAWLVPDLVDTFRRDHPRVRSGCSPPTTPGGRWCSSTASSISSSPPANRARRGWLGALVHAATRPGRVVGPPPRRPFGGEPR